MLRKQQEAQRNNMSESVSENFNCLKQLLKKQKDGVAQNDQIQQLISNVKNCSKMDIKLQHFETAFQQAIQQYQRQQVSPDQVPVGKAQFDFEVTVQTIFKKEEISEVLLTNHKWEKELQKILNKGKEEEDDGDLMVVDSEHTFPERCPLTFLRFKEPLKNPSCGHTYSKEGIYGLFQQNRGRASIACPVAGCSKNVVRSSLLPDEELIQHLRDLERKEAARKRSQAAQESDSDEGL